MWIVRCDRMGLFFPNDTVGQVDHARFVGSGQDIDHEILVKSRGFGIECVDGFFEKARADQCRATADLKRIACLTTCCSEHQVIETLTHSIEKAGGLIRI